MANPFMKGSQPYRLNEHFKQGKSLTHDEAVEMGIGRLAQRMQDLKNKYLEYADYSPILVLDESNNRGGLRARYFYKGANSPLQNKDKVRVY
ncbi:MAG: hypothetical protein QM497_04835 [Sulfurimonas sp.]